MKKKRKSTELMAKSRSKDLLLFCHSAWVSVGAVWCGVARHVAYWDWINTHRDIGSLFCRCSWIKPNGGLISCLFIRLFDFQRYFNYIWCLSFPLKPTPSPPPPLSSSSSSMTPHFSNLFALSILDFSIPIFQASFSSPLFSFIFCFFSHKNLIFACDFLTNQSNQNMHIGECGTK